MTPDQIETNHAIMVRSLMKSPADLHEQSTHAKWGLLHACIGIAGELGEVANATGPRHLLEEAGDTLFYCRDLRHILTMPAFVYEWECMTRPVTHLMSSILDHVKRLTIYNYEMDEPRWNNIHSLVNEIECYISNKLDRVGYTRLHALEHNLEKLLTGPDARYKGGQYSDLAAQLRADKTPDNDDV